MMATVPHVISGLGLRKFQAGGFLLKRVYKEGRCVGLATLPPSFANCLEIWKPQPPGTLRACPGL